MGYILKNTSGLVNTRLTDTARKKLSEGRFNISYFQVGDSEVSYNTLPSTYNQMDTNILEPEFNAQNSTGAPESNKQQVKYPYYVDAGSKNTYGVPFMASVSSPVYNRAAMRGFFSGNTTAETISWSALTNDQYAINSNYVVDMSTLTCTDNIDLILSSCYTDPVREPQAGDIVTIYYDGNGLVDCSCIYPTPTPSVPPSNCWTTGFTWAFYGSGFSPETYAILPFTDSGYSLNGKPIYNTNPLYFTIYWDGSNWIFDYLYGSITLSNTSPIGNTDLGEFGSGYTECGETKYICVELCKENESCQTISYFEIISSGITSWVAFEGTYPDMVYSADTNEFVLISSSSGFVGSLSGLTENDYPIGTFTPQSPYTAITTSLGVCSNNFQCYCESFTADTGDDTIKYIDCNGLLTFQDITSGNTFSACVTQDFYVSTSGTSSNTACDNPCTGLTLGNYFSQIYSVDPCVTPSPTPTPSATCCPVPSPTPACPLPEHASCVVDIDSCHQVLTYKITKVCGSTIYLDRNTPDFSNYLTCYARVIIYPSSITEIYDSYTPRPHWNDNVIDFESVCGVDALDVKIWNMNIPWSENPAGLNPSISMDYTTFGSRTYLGTKEYLGYASSLGQTFYNPVTDTSGTTDTYYYNSLGDVVYVEPEEQKAIAVIHYTNNTIDFFYGEKFALQPYDPQNPQDTTGQARNFRIHLPWVMWHKNTTCCNGETFYVDPPNSEFEGLDLFQVHYIQSTKNNDMNNPGIRYYHLWDTHANVDGYPTRVGKVFPDHKIVVIDDEELIAVMSYKSNRNWTLPAPRLSLITPNTCGNDTNSTTGILTGNGQTLYVTYRLSDPYTCTENLHSNYYPSVTGPNLNCNNIQPQNVAVRFGSEFNCLNQSVTSCWDEGFKMKIIFPVGEVNYHLTNTHINFNGKPIYSDSLSESSIYWDGSNWVLDYLTNTSTPIVLNSSSPLSTFTFLSVEDILTGITSCEPVTYLCLTYCDEITCSSQTYYEQSFMGTTFWTPDIGDVYITYSADTSQYVVFSGGTPVGTLTGLTESDYPVGSFTPVSPFTAITTTLGSCPSTCDCISFTADTGDESVKYMDCYGILNTSGFSSGNTFSACVINNLFIQLSGNSSTGTCEVSCYTTTTTTCPPVCLLEQGYFASKFEIICQLVEGGGRPQSDEWKIIDFTDQISATTYNGYLTQSGLTGSTFVITLDDYDNAPYYDLNDYISLTPVGSSGYSLNFGDEYYFYGNIETDIEATIYEMKYKVNLSQSEFQLSSNPSWTLGSNSYITEIGLYDNEKDLMIVSKLQSPVLRQGVQQFLIKFDF